MIARAGMAWFTSHHTVDFRFIAKDGELRFIALKG
jgi:hypothetical protein